MLSFFFYCNKDLGILNYTSVIVFFCSNMNKKRRDCVCLVFVNSTFVMSQLHFFVENYITWLDETKREKRMSKAKRNETKRKEQGKCVRQGETKQKEQGEANVSVVIIRIAVVVTAIRITTTELTLVLLYLLLCQSNCKINFFSFKT